MKYRGNLLPESSPVLSRVFLLTLLGTELPTEPGEAAALEANGQGLIPNTRGSVSAQGH